MRICLDASVAVAAERTQEPGFAAARARVARILGTTDDIVVPALFSIEVASALARLGHGTAFIMRYLASLLVHAELVTIGPRRAPLIANLAALTKLRAADATYAWVAKTKGVTLVTLDTELLGLDAAVCSVERP